MAGKTTKDCKRANLTLSPAEWRIGNPLAGHSGSLAGSTIKGRLDAGKAPPAGTNHKNETMHDMR